jgi:hypothetical protein
MSRCIGTLTGALRQNGAHRVGGLGLYHHRHIAQISQLVWLYQVANFASEPPQRTVMSQVKGALLLHTMSLLQDLLHSDIPDITAATEAVKIAREAFSALLKNFSNAKDAHTEVNRKAKAKISGGGAGMYFSIYFGRRY